MSLTALYAAATGMDVQQATMDSIANNLANINTTGFKASRAGFEDLMYEQVQTPGLKNAANTPSPIGIQIGHGARLVGVYKDFRQGEFVQTDRQLDVAIEGAGFFKVTLDNGTAGYTRDGGLKINSTGILVSNRGYQVEPAITMPADATAITVGQDGTVSVTQAGVATPTSLGQLQLIMFQNPSGLKSIGQNLYQETDASGTPTSGNPGANGAGTLAQGFLENANVNVAEELINMIVAQRAYEANAKVLSTTNEMMRASSGVV